MIAMGKYEDENGLKDMMQRSVPDRMIYNGFPGQFESYVVGMVKEVLWKSPCCCGNHHGCCEERAADLIHPPCKSSQNPE
jgi:hypothetical protein